MDTYIRAAYMECEVKVGEMVSDSFGVRNGFRQGCILSPILCSLYINSLLGKLRGAEARCKDLMILALLYADDMVVLAEDKEMLRKALTELGEWCAEWSVKVNVKKCGIMHMRKKGVKWSEQKFVMNGEVVQNVVEYKYLGCIINGHVESKVMIDSRVKAGARALCTRLRRCRSSVGELKGGHL